MAGTIDNRRSQYTKQVIQQTFFDLLKEKDLNKITVKEIAEKGFSPSALTSYIRNPIDFYFQKILRISEVEEVEENIALNTLGTIIHGTLEALYTPFIGKFLSETDILGCFKLLDDEVNL